MNAWARLLAWLGVRRSPPALPAPARRGYDGADRGRRLRRWRSRDDGPTARTSDLKLLRDRSRDLRRNNPYAARGLASIVSNTVGTGIVPRFQNEKVAKRWQAWAESRDCDALGVHDFAGLQALVLSAIVESGEVFVLRRRRETKEGLAAPVQLQVLEPDYLDASKMQSGGTGPVIEHGIEYDSRGRPIAYWFYKRHPSSALLSAAFALESERYEAADVIHLFRVDRPGQGRGVPWLAPVMARLRLLDDYEDAALERARVAACFAAFVKDPIGEGIPVAAEPDEEEEEEELSEAELAELDYERIEPGAIEYLPNGKDVSFPQPPTVNDYEPFTKVQLRAIAAGLGVPYATITGDLGGASFSSERIGWLEFDRQIEAWRWGMLIPGFCDRVFAWWKEAMGIAAGLPSDLPQWSAPRREMISPTEETRSLRERVRAGFISQPEAIRQLGYDPDALLAEQAEWNEKADEVGVVLDTDPRKIGGPSGNVALAPALEEQPSKGTEQAA
jgi:lambda family phage portal protein